MIYEYEVMRLIFKKILKNYHNMKYIFKILTGGYVY